MSSFVHTHRPQAASLDQGRPHPGQLTATACRGLQGICREKVWFQKVPHCAVHLSHIPQTAHSRTWRTDSVHVGLGTARRYRGRRRGSGGRTQHLGLGWPRESHRRLTTIKHRALPHDSRKVSRVGAQVCLPLHWAVPRSLVSVLSPEILTACSGNMCAEGLQPLGDPHQQKAVAGGGGVTQSCQ